MSTFPYRRLGDLIEDVSERNRSLQCTDVYSVTNSQGFIPSEDYFNKKVFSKDLSNYKLVRQGMFAYNPSRINVGSIAWLKDMSCVAVSPLYVVFRIKEADILPSWVEYFLRSNVGRAQIRGLTSGSVRDSLKYSALERIELPIAPIEVQRDIVANLSALEQSIKTCETLLEKMNELIKSQFVEMFGDPVTNPKGWETVKIADALIIEPQNGLYKPQSDYVHDKSGIPILRIDGFYEGKVSNWLVLKRLKCTKEEIQKYLLHEGDIVINRVNSIEHLGKCAHISNLHEPTVYESNMMRMHFDPTRFNPVYITRLLCTQYIYNQIINHSKKAVNQASINQKDVMDFNIYHPPLALQNEFAAFVEQADKSKLVLRQLLEKQKTLKAALMQEYFF